MAGDFTFAAGQLRIAISFVAGTLNSVAAIERTSQRSRQLISELEMQALVEIAATLDGLRRHFIVS
jgi:hypothetical protein